MYHFQDNLVQDQGLQALLFTPPPGVSSQSGVRVPCSLFSSVLHSGVLLGKQWSQWLKGCSKWPIEPARQQGMMVGWHDGRDRKGGGDTGLHRAAAARNCCKSKLPTLSAARRPAVFSLLQPGFNCRFIFRQTGCLHLRLSASQAL